MLLSQLLWYLNSKSHILSKRVARVVQKTSLIKLVFWCRQRSRAFETQASWIGHFLSSENLDLVRVERYTHLKIEKLGMIQIGMTALKIKLTGTNTVVRVPQHNTTGSFHNMHQDGKENGCIYPVLQQPFIQSDGSLSFLKKIGTSLNCWLKKLGQKAVGTSHFLTSEYIYTMWDPRSSDQSINRGHRRYTGD